MLRVTYVGNEGVIVASRSRRVVIDGVFGHNAQNYTGTPSEVVDAAAAAAGPFEDTDVLLATHRHLDHFDPVAVGSHLLANGRTQFVSTRQSADRIAEAFERHREIADRVHVLLPPEGATTGVDLHAVHIEGLRMSHGRVRYADVELTAFLLDLQGESVLHLGDAIIDERTLEACRVLDRPIDAAFLPFWYLTYPYGREVVRGRVRAKRLFVVHIPPLHAEAILADIYDAFPDAIPLRTPLETHVAP